MAREVLLKIYEGERANEEFIFKELGAYLIGRSAQCALQISKMKDKKISRGHLLFILGMSGVRIRDLGSRNGTLLNGVKLDPGEISDSPEELSAADSILNPGDKVTMGDTVWGIEFIIPELSQVKLEQASKKLQERKASLLPSVSQATPPSKVVDVHPKKKLSGPTISFASKLKKVEGPTVKKQPSTSPISLSPMQKTLETPAEKTTPPAPISLKAKEKPASTALASKPSKPLAVDEERETDKNPPVKPKAVVAPIVLGAKHKKSEVSSAKNPHSLHSQSLKEEFSFDKDKVGSSHLISDQDVYDKLGTAEETVSMEAEEFDNLDDLVFKPPEQNTKKRTTSFKIKSPKA